jgi:flagellar biosynthesis/type III secretory pathway protein FliH
MAKYQLHLSKPVKAVGRLESLRGDPLAVNLIELPGRESSGTNKEKTARAPSEEEKRLQQQFQQLEQEVAAGVQKIEQKLDELASAQENQKLEFRQLAVKLAVIATRTVLKQLNHETEQRLEQLVSEGLSQMPGVEAVTIRLHPTQCDKLAYHFDELSSQRKLRFLPDPMVRPGEVTLEHPLFSLTSDLNEQLNQMEQALNEEMLH